VVLVDGGLNSHNLPTFRTEKRLSYSYHDHSFDCTRKQNIITIIQVYIYTKELKRQLTPPRAGHRKWNKSSVKVDNNNNKTTIYKAQ